MTSTAPRSASPVEYRVPALAVTGLRVARAGSVLLDRVDFVVDRGEIVVVIGPNGVGKSTLLHVIAGLLPAAAGEVAIAGRSASALQSPALARRSVRANLELAMSWWGVPRSHRAERLRNALRVLRIEHLADRHAHQISGGEARRVHLARVLVLNSDVLLLDEPFAGLDPPTRAELLADASTALRDPERATVVVVHDRAEAWALADRLIVLLDGGVAAQGTPNDVLERPATPSLARFVGFTGELREGEATRYLRPAQVALDADGSLLGRVERRVPEEEGVLLELAVEGGRLQVRSAYPGPGVGDQVRVRLDGGVRFPNA